VIELTTGLPAAIGEQCPRCGVHVFSDDVTVISATVKQKCVRTVYLCRCGELFRCEWKDLGQLWKRVKEWLNEDTERVSTGEQIVTH
jgi:hypothetical protein